MTQTVAAVVRVQLGERSYPITVGSNLLGAPASYRGLPRGGSAVIRRTTWSTSRPNGRPSVGTMMCAVSR